MSKALEERYKALGGTIHYKKRVEKILTTETERRNQLEDGTEHKVLQSHLCGRRIYNHL